MSELTARTLVERAIGRPVTYLTYDEVADAWTTATAEEREQLARAFPAWANRVSRRLF